MEKKILSTVTVSVFQFDPTVFLNCISILLDLRLKMSNLILIILFLGPFQQQILLQNGQTILQPLNLIGQQLLVPAGSINGLMMTDTVLQIQNMAPCSLITPQGIVQNKSFLSPNSANQQFIVSGNGQISPIGQMFHSTPVGLVVPPNGPTFVQQSTTIVQQQTTMMNNSNSVNETDLTANIPQSVSTQTTQTNTLHTVTASPPDTTTHSPRSPERPESQRSVASDINMVRTLLGWIEFFFHVCMHGFD